MKHLFILKDTIEYKKLEEGIHSIMKGLDYKIIYTHSKQEVFDYIISLTTPHRIYSIGGDGSINLMLQKIVHTDHILVPVPFGTGNDFLRMFNKEKNVFAHIKKTLSIEPEKIDVIQLNDYYAINSVCFGIDALVANHIHDQNVLSSILKSKSYILSVIPHVIKYDFYPLKIIVDQKEIHNGPITLTTINNGQYYGGGIQITPTANVKDGLLEIAIADKVSKTKIPKYIFHLLKKELEKIDIYHLYRGKEIIVETKHYGNIDGEEIPEGTYHIQVLPQTLNIVLLK